MAKDIFHTLLLMGLKTNHNATLFQLKNDMLPFLSFFVVVFFVVIGGLFLFQNDSDLMSHIIGPYNLYLGV